MVIAIVVVLLIGSVVFGYVITHSSEPPADVDPEAALKAAVELHRIRRDLDVTLTSLDPAVTT
jgi:hypothetical protein